MFLFFYLKTKKQTDFLLLCLFRKLRRDMADFVVSDKDFIFVVSSNRYRKTNRAETFTFHKMNGLGVCVTWHEDKNDDEGEEVGFTNDFDDYSFAKNYYSVPAEALIRVVLCVPPMSENMNLTPVFVQANGVQETHDAVELEPGHPFELPFAVKLRGRAPVVWVLRDAQKKTVVELIFRIL